MEISRKQPSGSSPDAVRAFGMVYPVYPPSDAPKSIVVRFWRYWRRLIRRRQESREVRRLLAVIREQDDRVRLDLSVQADALKAADDRYRELVDRRIPKLERELEVERAYSEGLATALEKMRTQYAADIAVNQYRVAVGKQNEHEAKRLGHDD